MNREQAQTALNLVNVAISTIQKIAEQEQQTTKSAFRDNRFTRAILLLQEKQRDAEHFLKRAQSNGQRT
jgi:hypothetical protein